MKKAGLLWVLALAGCATQGPVAKLPEADELREMFQRNAVAVAPVKAPMQLVERTKAVAIGNFLVASLLSSAAGSSGSANSPRAFEANTQISQEFGRQLNQALPSGYETSPVQSADAALAQRLAARFRWAEGEPAAGTIQLEVRGSKWELAYESFLGSGDYVLSYGMEILASESAAEKPRLISRIDCAGSAPEKLPLEKWQEDDYRTVRAAALEIAGQCFEKAVAAYGVN